MAQMTVTLGNDETSPMRDYVVDFDIRWDYASKGGEEEIHITRIVPPIESVIGCSGAFTDLARALELDQIEAYIEEHYVEEGPDIEEGPDPDYLRDAQQDRDMEISDRARARIADRIDGYDRDDLGESPDY